jgi:sec-independent protein translocase protein TatA
MFGGKLGLPELLILFAIALLFFGPGKLADFGKGLGEGIKNFKGALKDGGNSGGSGDQSNPPAEKK